MHDERQHLVISFTPEEYATIHQSADTLEMTIGDYVRSILFHEQPSIRVPMKRAEVIKLLEYAGYHNDMQRFLSLYIENHISYASASSAFVNGRYKKEQGVPCTCSQCKALKTA